MGCFAQIDFTEGEVDIQILLHVLPYFVVVVAVFFESVKHQALHVNLSTLYVDLYR